MILIIIILQFIRLNNSKVNAIVVNESIIWLIIVNVLMNFAKNKDKTFNVHHAEIYKEHQEIYKIHTKTNDKFFVNVLIEGQQVTLELDMVAAISILFYAALKKLHINKRIFNTNNVELRTYTDEIIKPKGVVFVKCLNKDKSVVGKLYIVNEDFDSIFGRDWIREVSLGWAEL